MNKEDLKYIIMGIIFVAIIVLAIKIIWWLIPIAIVVFALYLVYVFVFRVKDRTIELSKKSKKKDNIKEAEIVDEKNEE